MAIFRNAEGDVLDVPESLAAFVAARGYNPEETAPAPAVEPVPQIPAETTPDPAAGDNDSKGVTNNG